MKINVTAGGKEYAVATVTEKNGLSLETTTITVGLSTSTTPPTTWQTPDVLDISGAVATASLLIDNVDQIGNWYLWAKVADAPEVILLRVSGSKIEVV